MREREGEPGGARADGSALRNRLKYGPLLVSDGAMGTLLLEAGLEPGACPDALALEDGEALSAIARRYAAAGAELVHTDTFGASPLKLAEYHLEDRTEDINTRAVLAARAGAPEAVFVSGSMGPCGRLLEPYGDAPEDMVFGSFERQAAALIRAGADAITVETMIDLREAALAVKAVRAASGEIPVLATMTFQDTPRGFITVMGNTVAQVAEGLLAAGADAVGSNCGNGVHTMVSLAGAFRAVTDRPLVIQANAGVPHLEQGRLHYPETPADFGRAVPLLAEAGVSLIGGCCGSDPAHVRAIRHAVDALQPVD